MDVDLKYAGELHRPCDGMYCEHMSSHCQFSEDEPWPCDAARFRDALIVAEAALETQRQRAERAGRQYSEALVEDRQALVRATAERDAAEADADALRRELGHAHFIVHPDDRCTLCAAARAHDARRQP